VKAVILGGTSGMGRALAQRLSERGDDVFLLGREADKVDRSAADLKARHPQQRVIGHALCDLERPSDFAPALDAADAALGGFDTVIVTAGLFATQDVLEADIELTTRLVTVNYAHTLVFCEHARKRLLARGGGSLVVFSSVAGDRGRKPVAIYGSSKAGISAYLEALDHKYHERGEPDAVARQVLAAIDQRRPVVYAPGIWALVMFVIRHLPRSIMRRIGF
jgi:decaprenylphospho-beta-D-erythro-pentofuranosid-2-ulose 2-reductase